MINRLPAEWEPCEAVWVAWPHNADTWPGRFRPVPAAMTRLIRAIADHVLVRVLVDPAHRSTCREYLTPSSTLELIEIPNNDAWVRDYGPMFVFHDGKIRGVDWKFNAWGNKYHPHDLDAAAGAAICRHANIPRIPATLVVEGGAVETDGNGRLIAHTGCFLDDQRNPGRTTDDFARAFHQLMGITEIAWIDGGNLPGDDTDGHIDQLARFVDPTNVVVAVANDPAEPHAGGLETNFRQLSLWSDQTTPGVNVHRLATPPSRQINDQPVPQSYCNFLRVGRDAMLVPTFDDRDADDHALGLLRDLCSGTRVIGIPCEDLAWGLGAIHCLTLSQPHSASAETSLTGTQ